MAECGRRIRGVIFDFDGLILDTEVPAFRAWQEIYARHGVSLRLETWADFVGRAPETIDPYGDLERALGRPIDRETLHAEEMASEAQLIEAEPIRPGVVVAIAEARRLGLALAIASSSSRDWVLGHLDRLGLGSSFNVIRCSDDVARTKPEPDLYLAALAALGLSAGEAIALEDSPHGVAAAKRAGLYCVAVPNDLTRHLPLDGADRVVSSLAEVAVGELVSEAEGRAAGG